jgi:hypothetical protein
MIRIASRLAQLIFAVLRGVAIGLIGAVAIGIISVLLGVR